MRKKGNSDKEFFTYLTTVIIISIIIILIITLNGCGIEDSIKIPF